jgi:ribosomal protein S18 acetylase RimI-like enzyme
LSSEYGPEESREGEIIRRRIEVLIQPANISHLLGMARLYGECFPSRFVDMMGTKYLLAWCRSYIAEPGGIAIVALDEDEKVVGLVVGGERGIEYRFVRRIPIRFFVRLLWGFVIDGEVRRLIMRRCRDMLKACRRGMIRFRSGDPVLPGTAWLCAICVHPDARGSGIADYLLAAFRLACKMQGYNKAMLRVHSENAAVRCYERNGWHIAQETDDHYHIMSCDFKTT